MSQKLIVKTAVKTALILLGIIAVAFAIFNIAFPQHMATAMESVGSYGMAVKYANLRYTYTGDGYDLARCFDDSVLDEDNEKIVYYGEELASHVSFSSVCNKKDLQFGGYFNYRHRVYSSMAKSYYALGEWDNAIKSALKDNGTASFAYGNSLMVLAYSVCEYRDVLAAQKLIVTLNGIFPSAEEDKAYLSQVITSLQAVLDS